MEETALLLALKKSVEEKQRVAWVARNKAREELQRAEFQRKADLKNKLSHIQPQFNAFVAKIQAVRQEAFDVQNAEFHAYLEKQRKEKKAKEEEAERERAKKAAEAAAKKGASLYD